MNILSKVKRGLFAIVSVFVIGVALYQLYPLFKGETIKLYPFNVEFSLNKSINTEEAEAQNGDEPEVLGLISGYTGPYSTYAAGFSGVTTFDVSNMSTVGSTLYLGGLGQGGVMGNASKGLAGYGTSYLQIYNPGNAQSAVYITFYQLAGEELGKTEVKTPLIGIAAQDGIVEPFWIKLKAACLATTGCNPSLVGPETAWAGYAKVEVRQAPSGFIGIFAVSESVSADGEYAFGHDAFLDGKDIRGGSSVLLQNIGAGEPTGRFSLRDTHIMVGYLRNHGDPADPVVRFRLHKSGGTCTTCRTVHDQELTTGHGLSIQLSDLLALPAGQSWNGWAEVYVKMKNGDTRYQTIVTADSVNAERELGWGQNGLDYTTYPGTALYVGTVAKNLYLVEDSEVTIVNPTNIATKVQLQAYCHLVSGGDGWAPISGYYARTGEPKPDISIPAYGQITIFPDQFYGTFGPGGNQLCLEDPFAGDPVSFALNLQLISTTGESVISLVRDVLPPVTINGHKAYAGRAHRSFRTIHDRDTTIYVPGALADFGDSKLPSDPYNPSAFNMLATGWMAFNVNFVSGANVITTLTTHDILGSKTVYSTEIEHLYVNPDTFDPNTNGAIVRTTGNQFVGGYAVFSLKAGYPPDAKLVVYANQAGKSFWRSSRWSGSAAADVYSATAANSKIPLSDSPVYSPYYSSYVYSSASPKGEHDFGSGYPSENGWTMYNYNFSAGADAYTAVKSALENSAEVVPYSGGGLANTINSRPENGVYEILVPTANQVINYSQIVTTNSKRVIFIKPQNPAVDLELSITPSVVHNLLLNENPRQRLLLVVDGDVVIRPGQNAIGTDGGDFLDVGLVVTGEVRILSDDTDTPEISYWQRDPLLINGLLFVGNGIVNNRSLGLAKNTLYPSLMVSWDPGLLIELGDYFDKNAHRFDIPGIW